MRLLYLASALSSVSLALAWTTYVVPHSDGNDDTPALAAAFAANPELTANATILFQQGVTYNILTPILFPYFENVVVSVQGNLSYGADVKATQGEWPITRWYKFLKLISGLHLCQRSSGLRFVALLRSETCELTGHLILCRVSQDGGLCLPSPANSNLTPTLPRFKFAGGSNVTLEGSTDPHWGWVNSHGQQVGS